MSSILFVLCMTGAGANPPDSVPTLAEGLALQDDQAIPPGFAWSGRVTAGMTILRGNSKSTQASADAEVIGEGEKDRVTFRAGWITARQEDPNTGSEATTARRLWGSAKYDRFLSERLFTYALAQAEKDGVRELDLLWNVGVGAGYQWIREDTEHLSTEGGLGFTDEDYEDDTADTDYFSARAALHYDNKFSATAEFFHDSEWLPSVEDFSDDQIVHTATGVRSQLASNLSGEAKVLFNWDSSPATGFGRRDVTYILGVTWTF